MDPSCYNHLNILKKGLDLGHLERSFELNSQRFLRFRYINLLTSESLGLLVPLGFAIAGLTPAAYQGRRLRPPSMEILSWGRLRA